MPATTDDIAKVIQLVFRSGGYLPTSLDNAANKATIDIEQYILLRSQAGADEDMILEEILAATEDQQTQIFGSFKADIKQAMTGAVNIAATNGVVAEILSGQTKQQFEEDLWRWQSNGVNVCPDCQERHGELDTMENWVVRGLPSQFGSRCGVNCQCMLVPEDVKLDPIKVGVPPTRSLS